MKRKRVVESDLNDVDVMDMWNIKITECCVQFSISSVVHAAAAADPSTSEPSPKMSAGLHLTAVFIYLPNLCASTQQFIPFLNRHSHGAAAPHSIN